MDLYGNLCSLTAIPLGGNQGSQIEQRRSELAPQKNMGRHEEKRIAVRVRVYTATDSGYPSIDPTGPLVTTNGTIFHLGHVDY